MSCQGHRNLGEGLRSPSKMDEMKKSQEIMNSSPTVEYEPTATGLKTKNLSMLGFESDVLSSRRATALPRNDRADHLRFICERAERRLFETI